MGVLIKGMDMPKDGELLCVNIYPDGKVCINLDLECKRIATAVDALWELPSAEKTGEWLIPQRRGVMSWNEKAYAECSVCHEVIFNARPMKFCPQCGARMAKDD